MTLCGAAGVPGNGAAQGDLGGRSSLERACCFPCKPSRAGNGDLENSPLESFRPFAHLWNLAQNAVR